MPDLARALVEHGALTAEGAARAALAARGGDVASAALELGLADEAALAHALARIHQCPAVELGRSAIECAVLDVVPPAECRARRVLPLSAAGNDLLVAMAAPGDDAAADALRVATGRRVLRCAAVAVALSQAIDALERARAAGAPAWRGPRAPPLADRAAVHTALVLPNDPAGVELPDETSAMELEGIAEPVAAAPPRPAAPPPRTVPPPAAPGRHPPDAAERPAGQGKSALVADDAPEVRTLIASALRKLGCAVLEVGDGKAALAKVREARPDVVVLDAMMPGLHGFEVCRAIKGDPALRATRVVLCSAVYRGTVAADAREAFGADAFVEKPFRLEELTHALRVALAGPEAAEGEAERAARAEAAALWRQAAAALARGGAGEALAQAQAAAAKDPWCAEAHYYAGHALAKVGRLYEAIAAFERASELRPDVDTAHRCRAQLYEKLGFLKSAREAWARAVETCPDPSRRASMQARLMHLLGG